jgi:hypothetical protein
MNIDGRGGMRTYGPREGPSVFKTGAIAPSQFLRYFFTHPIVFRGQYQTFVYTVRG